MRLAANVAMIFRHLPFAERIPAALAAGMNAVELYWPEPGELPRSERARFAADLTARGVTVVQLNFIVGQRLGVDSGLAGEPDRAHIFRENIAEAIELAALLGCRRINALAGNRLERFSPQQQHETLIESLAQAADAAAAQGVSVMVEALNRHDHPAFLLPDVASVLATIAELGRPNVKLLFDVYHAAMNGEDLPEAIARAGTAIGNVQLADVPGRHEPGSGAIDFAAVLGALKRVGYDDWIAFEYVASSPADAVAQLAGARDHIVRVAAGL